MKKAKGAKWYKLDNAAQIYPAVATSRISVIFRVSAFLKENVDPERLERAANDIIKRFPTMNVRLRSGFFWHFLEENQEPVRVFEETGHPCMRFLVKKEPLIRFLYYGKQISVEFFHSVTDGTGGMIFLKTLVARYLELSGVTVQYDNGAVDYREKPRPEELEDTVRKLKLPKCKISSVGKTAYHFPGEREMMHTLHIISAMVDADVLKEKAKSMQISVNDYLVAALMYTAYLNQKKSRKKPRSIRVQVPINLRPMFQSQTLRNFSQYLLPEIHPELGDYTFEEIASVIHHYDRYASDKNLIRATLAGNIGPERSIVRFVPLPLKNMFLNIAYYTLGDVKTTAVLSNFGLQKIPTGCEEEVVEMTAMLGPAVDGRSNVAVCTCNGRTRILFSRTIAETGLEKGFLRFLVEQGIPVSVTSNDTQED